MTPDLIAVIGRVGSLAQLANLTLIALLTGAVFYSRRPAAYFGRWAFGWGVLLCAMAALQVRSSHLTAPEGVSFLANDEHARSTIVLYYVYMSARLGFLGLLFVGTRMFARPTSAPPSPWAIALGSLVAAGAILGLAPTFNLELAVQGLIAVPVFASCAFLVLTLPPEERSLGSRALAIAFMSLSFLWLGYTVSFALQQTVEVAAPLLVLTSYRAFLDAILQTLLAYGMVLVVMEQTTRESVAAHAELDRAHQTLRQSAFQDALSGAYNRHAFSEGMGLAHVGDQPGTVVVLDVDHLKAINDSLGHDAGDALIRRVAQGIEAALTHRDAFYRWGGDEFLVVLAGCDAATARQRLKAALGEAAALGIAGVVVPVRASFGCAEFASLEVIATAISRADRGMYEEKSRRRVSRDTPVAFPAFTG